MYWEADEDGPLWLIILTPTKYRGCRKGQKYSLASKFNFYLTKICNSWNARFRDRVKCEWYTRSQFVGSSSGITTTAPAVQYRIALLAKSNHGSQTWKIGRLIRNGQWKESECAEMLTVPASGFRSFSFAYRTELPPADWNCYPNLPVPLDVFWACASEGFPIWFY